MINQASGQAGHPRVTGLFDSPMPGPHQCPEECLFGVAMHGAVRDQAVLSRMTGCAPQTAIERGEPNCVESADRPPAQTPQP